MAKANLIERVIAALAPGWALSRARSRHASAVISRHYEAAAIGRRTQHWNKSGADPNVALSGSLSVLRALARDLVRNNPWARRGLQVITNNAVGWGIVPKPRADVLGFAEAWRTWAETTECDADGRLTFYGLQRQVLRTVAEAGEVLVRRRPRRPMDGLSVPLQLQLIEPDLIDVSRDRLRGEQGGPVIQGIEFDAIGRRVAYWLYDQHPGSSLATGQSRRIPADGILHVFQQDRPGQVRGVPWLAPVLVRLRDFDEYEDAVLMRQKIAACFSAFVVDTEGTGAPLGTADTDAQTGEPTDTLDPGAIVYLPPGKDVRLATPPGTGDHDTFSGSQLRSIAAGLGVTYEDLTGDYSQSNYSSSRMGRIAHWENVEDWRWNLLVPQFCQPVLDWFAQALTSLEAEAAPAEWTPPPQPMVDPDKEGLALMRLVRVGAKTHDQMVREMGTDPERHWQEYADGLARLDRLGIIVDSDPRNVSQNGVMQPAEEPPSAEPPAPAPTNGKPTGAPQRPVNGKPSPTT